MPSELLDGVEFTFSYSPPEICIGENAVTELPTVLDRHDVGRVLVVAGRTVGSTQAVIGPLKAALGDRLIEVFDRTTPEKRTSTAFEGIDRMNALDIDGLVAVGGGSSIDVAQAMSVFQAEDRPAPELFSNVSEDGSIQFPELSEPKVPVYCVPTTFSGAELTCAAGINLDAVRQGSMPGTPREGPIYDPAVMPRGLFYDSTIIDTTPRGVLAASGMNGLDHGIEMLYSRHSNPITDATATRGLRLLSESLPTAVDSDGATEAIQTAAAGVVLASYGLVDPTANANKYSLIHAFGHIISRHYDMQQGQVHGIVAPNVLEYIFDSVDGRRTLLAEGLDIRRPHMSDDEMAAAIIDDVASVRDALDLPTRLKQVPGFDRDEIPLVADGILQDVGIQNGPAELNPTREEIRDVLLAAF